MVGLKFYGLGLRSLGFRPRLSSLGFGARGFRLKGSFPRQVEGLGLIDCKVEDLGLEQTKLKGAVVQGLQRFKASGLRL